MRICNGKVYISILLGLQYGFIKQVIINGRGIFTHSFTYITYSYFQ